MAYTQPDNISSSLYCDQLSGPSMMYRNDERYHNGQNTDYAHPANQAYQNGYHSAASVEKGNERMHPGYNGTQSSDYNYSAPVHRYNGDEGNDDASHLSFLYDKAQGGDYTQHPYNPPSSMTNADSQRIASSPYGNGIDQSNHANYSAQPSAGFGDRSQPSTHTWESKPYQPTANEFIPVQSYGSPSHKNPSQPPLPPMSTHPSHNHPNHGSPKFANPSNIPVIYNNTHCSPESLACPTGSNTQTSPQRPSLQSTGSSGGGRASVTSPNVFLTPSPLPQSTAPSLGSPAGQTNTDELKKRTLGELSEKLAEASLGNRESLRNYENWKAQVNQRKMSLPGYVDASRMQRFERKVPAYDSSMSQSGGDSSAAPRARAELDGSSIHQQLREDDPVGEYEQTSIRYVGRQNPSKTFRLVQNVTGSDNESDIIHQHLQSKPPARQRRRVKKEEPQPNADDIVDITYVGGNIPSKTFRQLQSAVGEEVNGSNEYLDSDTRITPGVPARSVKVIHLRRFSVDNILEM